MTDLLPSAPMPGPDDRWPSGLSRRELLDAVPADRYVTTRIVFDGYRARRSTSRTLSITTIRNYLRDLEQDGLVEQQEFGNYHVWRRGGRIEAGAG